MSLRLAAAGVCAAALLVVAGRFGYKLDGNKHLSSDIAQILYDFKIAGTSDCKEQNCKISNLISQHFKISRINITATSQLFSFLKWLNADKNLFSELEHSWLSNLRGSRLWWLIYDSVPYKNATFSFDAIGVKITAHQLDTLRLFLSDKANLGVDQLENGFDLWIDFTPKQHIVTLSNSNINGVTWMYQIDLKNGKTHELNAKNVARFFLELDRIMPFSIQ